MTRLTTENSYCFRQRERNRQKFAHNRTQTLLFKGVFRESLLWERMEINTIRYSGAGKWKLIIYLYFPLIPFTKI